MLENWNYQTTSRKSLPYQILKKTVQIFNPQNSVGIATELCRVDGQGFG